MSVLQIPVGEEGGPGAFQTSLKRRSRRRMRRRRRRMMIMSGRWRGRGGKSRSEQAPGSVFHPVTKVEKFIVTFCKFFGAI